MEIENKEKIIRIVKDDKFGIFSIATTLEKNNIKSRLTEIAGNYIIVLNDRNVICSKQLADDNAEEINSKYCFDVL